MSARWLVLLLLAECSSGSGQTPGLQASVKTPIVAPVPGAINYPQPTLQQLCTKGYSTTIRPPKSYTENLKRKQMASQHLKGKLADYEEDHKVPLELGGAPMDPNNLWPELWADAHKKDNAENNWHRSVCANKAKLVDAQAVFLHDQWATMKAP